MSSDFNEYIVHKGKSSPIYNEEGITGGVNTDCVEQYEPAEMVGCMEVYGAEGMFGDAYTPKPIVSR